jgi:hypothetical protein
MVGGLMSYGTDVADMVSVYTGVILKGARPVDLAVLQPTKFAFVLKHRNSASALTPKTAPVGVDWTGAATDCASSNFKRARAIAQDSRRDPRSSTLEKLIQQKEERVADLETLRTRRDQAKAECSGAISSDSR